MPTLASLASLEPDTPSQSDEDQHTINGMDEAPKKLPVTGTAPQVEDARVADMLEGKGDIYAVAVRALLEKQWFPAVRACLAMLVTCFVQVTLLALLLQAASNNVTAIKAFDTDLFKVQLNAMQLQLCGVQYSSRPNQQSLLAGNGSSLGFANCSCLLHAVANITPPAGSNCSSSASLWLADAVQTAYNHDASMAFDLNDYLGVRQLKRPPTDSDDPHQLLLLMLLSFGVMGIFVLLEAIKATQLSYAVAVCGTFIRLEFLQPRHRNAAVKKFCNPYRSSVAFCAPLLQMAVAVLALCTAGIVLGTTEYASNKLQLILNTVAVAFVVEIDDKVGEVLSWILESRENISDVQASPIVQAPTRQTYTGCQQIQWACQKWVIVWPTMALVFLAQWYAYSVFQSAQRAQTGLPTNMSVGNMLLGLVLGAFMLVLLYDHPYVVPQTDDWLQPYCDLEGWRRRRYTCTCGAPGTCHSFSCCMSRLLWLLSCIYTYIYKFIYTYIHTSVYMYTCLYIEPCAGCIPEPGLRYQARFIRCVWTTYLLLTTAYVFYGRLFVSEP